MLELTPVLEHKGAKPLYIQLADYIKQEILSGKINPNEKLPSKRKLANYLEVSVNTIQSAYDQLIAEGYLESQPRRGLFVTALEDHLLTRENELQPPLSNSEQFSEKINIDFNSGKVDTEHFPYSIWRKLTIQSLYNNQGAIFNTTHPQGDPLIREEIAKYLYSSRSVRCSSEQIVIGAGTQVLMGLLALLIGRDKIYAVENPGFHRTRTVLQDQGIQTVPIPLDADGIDVNKLKCSKANVAYVTPSHQFPFGMVMPISRRMELLTWAESREAYIIEDDYDGEYRYKGKPIPSLQGLDKNGKVIYLGTFSKSLIPSIRISFMVLPTELVNRYKEHFTIYKQTASQLHQDTLYWFMKEGYWQSHLNKMRTLYRKKQSALITAIQTYLGDQVTIIGEKSGLHIVLEINSHMTEEELILLARKTGVKIYPLSIYYDQPADTQGLAPRVLLGFGGLTENEMETGIKLLKDAWSLKF